jgi:hypothetical protein
MLMPADDEKASCTVDAGGPLYWGRSKQFWTRIVVAVIGALTMMVAAYLGRH